MKTEIIVIICFALWVLIVVFIRRAKVRKEANDKIYQSNLWETRRLSDKKGPF